MTTCTQNQRSEIGRVSVIIANYNYGQFVGAAIESALDLDWHDVEVIVVDDGSVDGSIEVIRQYGSAIRVIEQENLTQRVARNRGFAECTGNAIIHLDSDDVLFPGLIKEAAAVWTRRISKVQVQVQRIDELGLPIGSVTPLYRRTPTPTQITSWLRKTTAYPTPPGSGNIYARWFLDKIFPLDASCGPATDSACLVAAPLLGEVVTVPRPLVGYRVHGANASNMLASTRQFPNAVNRARQRHLYGARLVQHEHDWDEGLLRKSRPLLQLRASSLRLHPSERPLPGDSRWKVAYDSLRAPLHPGPETWKNRCLVSAWVLAVTIAPKMIASRLISRRFRRRRG